jgi:hypothetical protein
MIKVENFKLIHNNLCFSFYFLFLSVDIKAIKASKQTNKNKQTNKKANEKYFCVFCKIVLDVGEMKTRGKWQIK